MILVKTLRHEPGSELKGIPYVVIDASKHVVEIRSINFKEEFPRHYEPPNNLVWVTKEDADYKYFIVNPKFIGQHNPNPVSDRIVQIAIRHIRDNRLNEIGI